MFSGGYRVHSSYLSLIETFEQICYGQNKIDNFWNKTFYEFLNVTVIVKGRTTHSKNTRMIMLSVWGVVF